MKVLFIASTLTLEGSNISLFNLVSSLQKEGHNCAVLSSRGGFFKERLEEIGVECEIIRFRQSIYPKIRNFKTLLYYIPFWVLLLENIIHYGRIKRFIADYKPDIIHTNVSTISIGYRIAKQLNINHVWHIREYMDKDFGITPIPSFKNRISKLKNSYTICITKDIQEHFQLQTTGRSKVVYNGILPQNAVYYNPKKEKFFLYAAFLMKCKGIYDLLEAYHDFVKVNSDTEYRLVLAGGYQDDTFKIIKQKLKDYKIESRVQILGKVEPSVIQKYMRTASLVIVPSFYEGFGRTTAEAMFNGCLVAGRDTGGTKEQFDNGVLMTGHEIALRFSNIPELVALMEQMNTQGAANYSEMVYDSQKVVKKLYSYEESSKQVMEFYNDIINERH